MGTRPFNGQCTRPDRVRRMLGNMLPQRPGGDWTARCPDFPCCISSRSPSSRPTSNATATVSIASSPAPVYCRRPWPTSTAAVPPRPTVTPTFHCPRPPPLSRLTTPCHCPPPHPGVSAQPPPTTDSYRHR